MVVSDYVHMDVSRDVWRSIESTGKAWWSSWNWKLVCLLKWLFWRLLSEEPRHAKKVDESCKFLVPGSVLSELRFGRPRCFPRIIVDTRCLSLDLFEEYLSSLRTTWRTIWRERKQSALDLREADGQTPGHCYAKQSTLMGSGVGPVNTIERRGF